MVILVTGNIYEQLYTGFIQRKNLNNLSLFFCQVMKNHLSFTLLTISILSLNILPVAAVESTSRTNNIVKTTNRLETEDRDNQTIADGQWCVRIPAMGIFCWDL